MTAPKTDPLHRTDYRHCRVCGIRLRSMSVRAIECSACRGTKEKNIKMRMRGEKP